MRGIIKGRGRKAAGENRTQLDGLSAFVLRNTQRQPWLWNLQTQSLSTPSAEAGEFLLRWSTLSLDATRWHALEICFSLGRFLQIRQRSSPPPTQFLNTHFLFSQKKKSIKLDRCIFKVSQNQRVDLDIRFCGKPSLWGHRENPIAKKHNRQCKWTIWWHSSFLTYIIFCLLPRYLKSDLWRWSKEILPTGFLF